VAAPPGRLRLPMQPPIYIGTSGAKFAVRGEERLKERLEGRTKVLNR